MQTCMKRIFSVVLFLALVLSCVPAVAFAAEAENTLNQAIASAKAGEIVKVEADANDVVYDNEGVILDLNGHNVNVTVAEGVTLSAIDSATDDYEGSFGTLTTNGNVAATVKTDDMKSYVAIGENGSYSFHRYYVSIAAISLKPASAALGYRAEFRGDDAVKNAVVEYGYELWANDNAHKTFSRSDALEKTSLTLRLSNLLREGNDQLNAMGSTATVGGKAYMTLNVGAEQITVSGTEQKTTLRQVIESINANVSSYGEAQLESVRTLCTTHAPWMLGWATDAIFGKGEAEGDDDLKVEITVDVTAENNILTEDATLSHGGVSATVPQGTVLDNGTTKLVLTISQKAASDSDVTKGEGETLIPLDVHIEGISESNTTPIIICLGNVLPKGLNIGNYDLHHVENGKTVAMTRVYTLSELDTHNEFYYDPATGAVTVAMSSFSEIALRSVATGTWENGVDHTWYNADATTLYIYNADQLWSFSQIVGGMAEGIAQDSFSGKTVVLYANIDLSDTEEDGKIFYPIGYYNSEGTYEKSGTAITSGFYTFEGTFDGNGHTISNFYHNTWEMKGDHNWYAATEQNYRDGMGLFGKVYGGTVKNLTVDNFSSDGEIATTGTIAAYADNGATFENITIFNCNPRVYNIGNGGIVGCVGWYNNAETDKNPVTFTNITVDNTNKISALWGSYDVACGGLVGQYYPTSGQTSATDNAGIHMENCHVAAQIDVYNDVCGNYMYYAYRYAGMLIGSVRENINGNGSELYPDTGRVYPNLDGITAENCTVHYGDWNHYYYCEFEKNGHPSYAQADEYKFSRIPESELVRDSEGNVTGCTHEHTDAEDNRAIYLPFYDQLVTGYGWGVTSMGITDIEGVTVLDRVIANSVEKFEAVDDVETEYISGAVVSIGDLFQAAETDAKIGIDVDAVQVFVSPADENSTVKGTYAANTSDWTKGYLVLTGEGNATITITDYNYCKETVLYVTVASASAGGEAYVKVTEAPADWSGEYLIVYDKYVFNGKDEVNGYISATVNNGTIAATDELKAVAVTIEAMDGGYSILTEDGYIYGTSGSNTVNYNTTTAQLNTIEFESENSIIITSNTSVLRFNDTSNQMRFRYFKSTSYSGQKAIALYKLVDGEAGESCGHADAEVTITLASCTSAGAVVITCAKCGTLETALPKLGHDYSVEVERVDATCTDAGSVTYKCIRCDEKNTDTLPATGHNYADGVCGNCGAEQPKNVLVTDPSQITAGGTFAIVAEYNGKYYALGPTVEKSKILAQEVTIVDDVITSDVAVWTLESVDGGVAIVYGNNYLGWSSDANFSQPTNPYAWIVTENNGTFKFTASGANTRQIMLSEDALKFGPYSTSNETGYISNLYVFIINPCEHTNTTTATVDATCTEAGSITVTCDDCGKTISNETITATGHTTDNGVCDKCGDTIGNSTELVKVATFTLGVDAAADKSNSTASDSYSDTQSGYTLSISNGTKMYTGCTDGKGNGCIKIGSGSGTGSFEITVPQDVTQVVIYIAKYKTDAGTIRINGGDEQTISSSSVDGEYTAITVDTSTSKSITIATTNKRAMINTIEFWAPES